MDTARPVRRTSRDALVDDVMLTRPKVLGSGATVAEVGAVLADDHVHAALLVDGDRLVGVVVRDDLLEAEPEGPALAHATLDGRTVAVGTPLAEAQAVLLAAGARRLAVVDEAGRLCGLLARKRRSDGFCDDDGVAARRREREGR